MGESKSVKWFWISLATILGITFIVYYPTLHLLLRGESYCYFLDTIKYDGVWDLIKNFWNYESVRQIAPGDRLLFRPLLFTLLGIEKGMFGGNNYIAWRIISIVFHLSAVAAMFRILWKFKPGVLAFLGALLFGTSFLCLGTILYEQIASYALFTALLITAFYHLYVGTGKNTKKDLIIAAICMLIACFFHETGIIFTGLFIIYCVLQRKNVINWKLWCYVLGGILIVWMSIYFPTKFMRPARFLEFEIQNVISIDGLLMGLKGIWILASRWLQQSLLPAVSEVSAMVAWWSYPIQVDNVLRFNIPFFLNCIAVGLMGFSYLRADVADKPKRIRGPFVLLVICALGLMMFANAFYRTKSHGEHYLADHNFNVYIWLSLFTMIIYAFFCLQKLTKKHIAMNAIALLILIGINAPQTFMLSQTIKDSQATERLYLATIDGFIEEHQVEPDLSFRVVTRYPFQQDLCFTYWRVPDDVMSNFPTWENLEEVYDCFDASVPQIIYSKYWDEENPKYTLSYDINPGELEIVRIR